MVFSIMAVSPQSEYVGYLGDRRLLVLVEHLCVNLRSR